MGKMKDLTGMHFGELTVIGISQKKGKNGDIFWNCKCSCGKEKEIRTYSLTSGSSKSCGCKRKQLVSEKNMTNLLNQKIDKLLVIEKYSWGKGNIEWKCKCDCGNEIVVKSNYLLSKNNYCSCGCSRTKSVGEEKIFNLLRDNNYAFEVEKSFDSLRYEQGGIPRFDFYVENKYLIEYDGKQHFLENYGWKVNSLEEQKEKDNYKNNWCKDNNIPLIRIPYTHLKDLCIEDLLLETSTFII